MLVIAATPGFGQDRKIPRTELTNRLHRLFSEHDVATRGFFPLTATANGWHEYDDKFSNPITEENREKRRRFYRSILEKLQAIDRDRLDADDQLNYDVFRYTLSRRLELLGFDLHLLPIDQGGGTLPATFPVFGSGKGGHPFHTVRDYENFLKRIPGFVEWMDTAIANMRRGMARGFVQPRALMEKVLPQLAAMVVDEPQQSPFVRPILHMPEDFADEDRERLTHAYEAAIRNQIVPAYRRLHDFVRDEYLPACRSTAGLVALPGGDRLYAFLVRYATTTRLSPQEIFDIGRKEAARIRKRMETLKNKAGYDGDLYAWAAKLKTESVRFNTPEEVIAAYKALDSRVYPQLSRLFGRLPKSGYAIRPIEPHRENSTPNQYWGAGPGRRGVFYVNLGGLKKGPMTVSASLFLHEALPGHHLQMALQRENTNLPNFRKVPRFAAFVEGWGLYAESLGGELGVYDDFYQRLIWLNADLNRAVRLVVDVGLHAKGWSREEAIQFVMENTLGPALYENFTRSADRSIERYMAWPGQALAYKIGQLKISELRERAERKLGADFDLRAFHYELLRDGSLPLDILEAKMNRWIASRIDPSRH